MGTGYSRQGRPDDLPTCTGRLGAVALALRIRRGMSPTVVIAMSRGVRRPRRQALALAALFVILGFLPLFDSPQKENTGRICCRW